MKIKDWPEHERPREKLLRFGPSKLSDAELLAIFLRTGLPGKTAVDLARDLLDEFGSLRKLLKSNLKAFCAKPGLGPVKYAQLQAILEMGHRHLFETLKRDQLLTSPADSRYYFQARLHEHKHEVFACLFLDNHHRIIKFAELFHGTINMASVHPREVVKQALECNAAALILGHNHPSGLAEPSEADRAITQQLQQALKLVDIRVLDHIVVGDGETIAFSERGWISAHDEY